MTKYELEGIWNYYLSLESDISNTSRYIEPSGQEDVYSFEFAKLLILACTEIESVFKTICFEVVGKQPEGNISKYKEIILGKYPKIVNASVTVRRLSKNIEPFQGWSTGPLFWWSAYQEVKHSRGSHFNQATYKNAVYSIAALYVLILYLAKITNIHLTSFESSYIVSKYSMQAAYIGPTKLLPDFEVTHK